MQKNEMSVKLASADSIKYIGILLFFSFAFISCAADTALLEEYKLLYTDIENFSTCGYKSYYNPALNRATPIINDGQGTLQGTEYNFDCAIAGKGFFKIKVDDDIAYTRNGRFKVNENGELLTMSGCSFYEPLFLPEYFILESFYITLNHEIYVSVVENKAKRDVYIGQLPTYNIQTDLLEYYQEGLYKPKKYLNKETATDDKIICKFVEMSNYSLLAVLLRMDYILSNSNNAKIKNRESKKRIINIFVQKITAENEYDTENRRYLLEAIVPFIKYDY